MALQATRLSFTVALSNVDRRRELTQTLLVARHPSETQEHAILRVLAWCLVNEDGLEFGPGLSTPDAADLWTRDLTGRLTTWVECGAATAERLRKVQQHNPGIAVHVVLDDARRTNELSAELSATRLPRGSTPPSLWQVDGPLVGRLAGIEPLRQRWTVTVVGDHLYVDVDGVALDGAASRSQM
jgi:uncharacterized protein YaeQ